MILPVTEGLNKLNGYFGISSTICEILISEQLQRFFSHFKISSTGISEEVLRVEGVLARFDTFLLDHVQ